MFFFIFLLLFPPEIDFIYIVGVLGLESPLRAL